MVAIPPQPDSPDRAPWAPALEAPASDAHEPVQEQDLAMEFVTHYLTHYDSFEAARQCGYKPEYAFEYARKMMSDQDVIRMIDEKEQSKAKGDEKEFWKNRILKSLWREGSHKGHDSSHSARVSALKEIKNMFDLDGAVKVDATLNGQVTIYLPDNGRDKPAAEDGASN